MLAQDRERETSLLTKIKSKAQPQGRERQRQ